MSDTPSESNASCMDEYDPNALTVDAAQQRIIESTKAVTEVESIPIQDALNRVLSAPVCSTIDVPNYTNSAMDGYAINANVIPAKGTQALTQVATVYAGMPYTGTVAPGQCVRIMTGAAIPAGSDTVVMQEQVSLAGDQITVNSEQQPGQNVRHAGEDIKRGDEILTAGHCLKPADIGLLASVGIARVPVVRKIKVAFFSTGDELVPVGQDLGPGQIHDSNRYTLLCLLRQFGAEILDLGVVSDDKSAIEKAFRQAATNADMLITSGGVSVGDADFVKLTLEKLGQVNFWKIAMKPGRPLAYGRVENCDFFGLPGNPVSAMVTFYQFVLPALKKRAGQDPNPPFHLLAKCMQPLKKRRGRADFQRGILSWDPNTGLTVSSTGQQGSHLLTSMSKSNCFIVLPIESDGCAAGSEVLVQPIAGFF